MRSIVRSLVCLGFWGCCCCNAMGEGTSPRFWPFGRGKDAAELSSQHHHGSVPSTFATTENQTSAPWNETNEAGELEPERRWMIDSPQGRVSWPRFQMPEIPKPHLPRPQLMPERKQTQNVRNAWVPRQANRGRPSPWNLISSGAQRVSDGTRAAWHKTVDVLTPGDHTSPNPRVAQGPSQPPLWKRMFGLSQSQPQGPQTVTEWMAQERPGR